MLKYIVLFVFCFNAFAEDFRSNPDFKKLEDFTSQITTVQGKLTQRAGGEVLQSHFYLKVPAKLRVDYKTDDMQIQMVANPSVITYYDVKLDQKSQIKTPQDMVGLILTSKLSFLDKKINIKSFVKEGDRFAVSLSHLDLPNVIIQAIFNAETLIMQKVVLTKGSDEIIMEFEDLILNKEIKNSTFEILTKKIDAKFDF